MKLSLYTHFFFLNGIYVIMNSLTQALSFINKESYDLLKDMRAGRQVADEDNNPIVNKLWESGYMVPDSSDESAFTVLEMGKIRSACSRQLQQEICIIPNFTCSLNCSYCFQHEGRHGMEDKSLSNNLATQKVMTPEMVDRLFDTLDLFPGNKNERMVTIFGGEPLLPMPQNQLINNYICEKTREKNWDLRIYTNGIGLLNYEKLFEKYQPSVQVTFHDMFDKTADFSEHPFFKKWVKGCLMAVDKGSRVSVRLNISHENAHELPNICKVFKEMGLFSHSKLGVYLTPIENKKFCDSSFNEGQMTLFTRLMDMRASEPDMMYVDLIGWKIVDYFRVMAKEKDIPVPKFVRCPAMEKLLCFDVNGYIYSCYELAGYTDFALGTFYPERRIDYSIYEMWQNRTVKHEKSFSCSSCPTSLICGGGCAAESLRRENDIYAPTCEASREDFDYMVANHPDIIEKSIQRKNFLATDNTCNENLSSTGEVS